MAGRRAARRRSLVRLLVGAERGAHVTPATAGRAQRIAGDLNQRLALVLLVEGLLVLFDTSHEFLGTWIFGNTLRDARPVIAVGLRDAVTASAGIARPAGSVSALLGRAHHAVEFHCVALADLVAGNAAEIGLIGALTGDTVAGLTGKGRGAQSHGHREVGLRAYPVGASTHDVERCPCDSRAVAV